VEALSTRIRETITPRFPLGVLNRDLRLIFASNFMGSFGDGLYAYLLPVYIAGTLKATPAEVGVLYAIVNMLAASTLLLAGVIADRYDRKKIMAAGWGAWVLAPLSFALASNWVEMLPGMVLWGTWLGGPTVTAYVVTSADRSKLTLSFAALSASWSLGYVVSPALGGYLAASSGMKVVFVLASIFYASAGLILLFMRSQKPSGHTSQPRSEERYSYLQLLRVRRLLILSAFFALVMFTLMMFRPFVSKFLADVYGYSEVEIGISGSILFLGSSILGIFFGRLGDKWRKSYALASTLLFCSLSLALLLAFRVFPILAVAIFLAGCSYTLWSMMNAIIGPLAPEPIRARWASVPQTICMFSSIIAPYVGGVLYGASPYYPFEISIVVLLLLALLASTKVLEK
jgi:DHA1 family multidrug resistance protein-like MFS transporter